MPLLVNFSLSHRAYEVGRSDARLCYTGTFPDFYPVTALALGDGMDWQSGDINVWVLSAKARITEIPLKYLASVCVPQLP